MLHLPDAHIPEPLRESLTHFLQRFNDAAKPVALQDLLAYFEQQPTHAEQFARICVVSQFVADSCVNNPGLLLDLCRSGDLQRDYAADELQSRLQTSIAAAENLTEEGLAKILRLVRRREVIRFIWRDLNRLSSLSQLTHELSWLADACMQSGLDYLYASCCEQYGTPLAERDDGAGRAQQLIVIGMGKLGAHELNLSSDIDLIFSYPRSGATRGAGRSISNHEFFTRLGQRLIKLLDQHTADGFVFRVDMRLRPYGQSGALAMSFDAMNEYYQSQGRDWERYAMIKARIAAGDLRAGEQLLLSLRPFVYRRYIDFSVFESLRSMKAMIVREVARKKLGGNIKLGAGGIREIEFIVQAFQLLRGGRDAALRARGLLGVMPLLERDGLLPAEAVSQLTAAYQFLRNVEHALQAMEDRQTQELPLAEVDRLRLAFALGCSNRDDFSRRLTSHRDSVSQHFNDIIEPASAREDEQVEEQAKLWNEVWGADVDEDYALEKLTAAAYTDAAVARQALTDLHASAARMQPIGAQRLDLLMPLLLARCADSERPDQTLARVLPLLQSVLRRSAYLLLLTENRQALAHLVDLCSASPWIAQELARHPALLDELIDARTLFHLPDRAELQASLRQQMLRIDEDDLEAQMEQLRYFRLSCGLRVAAAEISGALPLMKVSDYLTFIAEAILQYVLQLAWAQLRIKYGQPQDCVEQGGPNFIIVAYGKLGGIELGHGSDLDLVFVHEGTATAMTDGERPLDSLTLYTRLGQRIIHILSTRTALGHLYEVDMRLRPSGDSGLLVSSVKAFENYQLRQAWTWEHQALVRARVVAGPLELANWFGQLRQRVLCQPRDAAALRKDVSAMRKKMRDHLLGGVKVGEFHLKHSVGAIVDIEFMVQYAVLRWSAQHPALCRYTDNIRILEGLEAAGLFSGEQAEQLQAAYKAYRVALHRRTLQQESALTDAARLQNERLVVQQKWRELFEE